LGFSSALGAASSVVVVVTASSICDNSGWAAAGDLMDCCVVEAALDAFAGLIGTRGTAGMVGLRACFLAAAVTGAACCEPDGVAVDGVVDWARSTSEGGCEVEGVSTSASDGPAIVDA
jgi:hypothetical protein